MRDKIFFKGMALVSVLFGFIPSCFAEDPDAFDKGNFARHYYLSLWGGSSWSYSGETDFVNLGGLTTNRYVGNTTSAVSLLAGVDLGVAWESIAKPYFFAVGLETSYNQQNSPAGTVNPLYLINPGFDTLNYTYAVSSVPLLAIAQIGLAHRFFNPYVIAGIGMAWNMADNYNEVPTDPLLSAAPMRSMFQPKTTYDFAYTAGLGFLVNVMTSLQLALEYRFTDYGDAYLNPTSQQSTGDTLSLGPVRSNALLFRLTGWLN
ncbi:MAG: hypothetical protein A3F10_01640 [Coxiella sp. RIFCSPHIGHO2_12_FULL_42_15]|nr:MAG: hypothetical protein A3F10_01640 [Coxiella sp. RIFCSPHIGHO2_12_FULL_42_15]